MARPCASCTSDHRAEIDKKLRSGATYDDVSRWLSSVHDTAITSRALARHAGHAGVQKRPPGRPPAAKDFLEMVRDRAAENVASGEAKVTVQHGLQAQAQLDARAKQSDDKRLVLVLAQVIGGGYVPDEIEGNFTELPALTDGTS